MINYLTIKDKVIHTIEIKKSKFITYLIPIDHEEQFHSEYDAIRAEHPKANHHCYAYIIEGEQIIHRMSDDGEPSGTAGVPMLEVLQKNNLNYIMAVIVRYFGGTKLGAGGLIRAYSTGVSETLHHATIVGEVEQLIMQIELEYTHNDSVNHYFTESELAINILDTQYTDKVRYKLAIFPKDCEEFTTSINNLTQGRAHIKSLDTRHVKIPQTTLLNYMD